MKKNDSDVTNQLLGGSHLVIGLQSRVFIILQCEAPKIAKLVQITPITMVYGTYN
jgi:hypothetical protein